jgi:hypothetical protein
MPAGISVRGLLKDKQNENNCNEQSCFQVSHSSIGNVELFDKKCLADFPAISSTDNKY